MYGSFIYNNLYNQCPSPLKFFAQIPLMIRCNRRHLCDIKSVRDLWQVCGFFRVLWVSSTNKTDCHTITEILLKVTLNTIILFSSYSFSKTEDYFALLFSILHLNFQLLWLLHTYYYHSHLKFQKLGGKNNKNFEKFWSDDQNLYFPPLIFENSSSPRFLCRSTTI